MLKNLIVANWKENLKADTTKQWLGAFENRITEGETPKGQVVVCPPFPLINLFCDSLMARSSLFHLGAQSVSHFEQGAYTGEVSAKQLKSIGVEYVIVGHSERRKNFHETDAQINQKIELCFKYNLTPIVCVSQLKQVRMIAKTAFQPVVAYEPLFAISTGRVGEPDTPAHAQKMALEIKGVLGQNTPVLYGGSVNSENIGRFLQERDVGGVLVGGASLDPVEFAKMTQQVALPAR